MLYFFIFMQGYIKLINTVITDSNILSNHLLHPIGPTPTEGTFFL